MVSDVLLFLYSDDLAAALLLRYWRCFMELGLCMMVCEVGGWSSSSGCMFRQSVIAVIGGLLSLNLLIRLLRSWQAFCRQEPRLMNVPGWSGPMRCFVLRREVVCGHMHRSEGRCS
jgi:hypothetical protein